MPKYIDAEELKKDVVLKSTHLLSEWDTGRVLDMIDVQEPADVAHVRHGMWETSGETGLTRCSLCGFLGFGLSMPKYCGGCGAQMDGKGRK